MTAEPITREKIGEWKRLAAAATAAPWTRYYDKLRPQFPDRIIEVQAKHQRCPIVNWGGFDDSNRPQLKHAANAAFIAASREAVPALIAEVERLTAALDSERSRKEGERIVRAAIVHDGAVFSVPQPGRHGDVIRLMAERTAVTHSSADTHEQGFLTSTGRFVDRIEGLAIAKSAGQMKPVKSGNPDDPALYSEDVW